MITSLNDNLDILRTGKQEFIDKLNEVLKTDTGLTPSDSWENIAIKIRTIITDYTKYDPTFIESLERLLDNNLEKTIQITSSKICDRAFSGVTSLVGIIASNVTTIYPYAFDSCNKLKKVILGDNNVEIQDFAFNNCNKLEIIDFTKIKTISNSAFLNCTSLKSIDLQNVTNIGSLAFQGCTGLTGTIYLNTSGSLSDQIFNGCSNIHEIIIEDTGLVLNYSTLANINTSVRILCEQSSKPNTWSSNWNASSYPVYWNAKVKDWTFVTNNDTQEVIYQTTRIIDKLPAAGEKENWTFGGWYSDSSYTDRIAPPYTSPLALPVLYAKWIMTVNIHVYNTETLETQVVQCGVASVSDLLGLMLGIEFNEVYLDQEYSIPLTDISQLNPGDSVYVYGPSRTIYDFDCTGARAVALLAPGKYQLECWGAEGGYRSSQSYSGKGGYAKGILTISQAKIFYIYVGGQGRESDSYRSFNGGGHRDLFNNYWGGGASDIRLETDSLFARLIVAGGGGSDGATNKYGMYGGGTNGGTATQSYGQGGGGGTQTAGGYGYSGNSRTNGRFGQGGEGVYHASGYGGAGGGGWYGGGGVYPDGSGDDDRGGGGGSGWVYTEAAYNNWTLNSAEGQSGSWLLDNNSYLTDTSLKAGNETFLSPTGEDETGHRGNGHVRITYQR